MPRGYTEKDLTEKEELLKEVTKLKLRILSERITDLSNELDKALLLIDTLNRKIDILEFSINSHFERMNKGYIE